MFPGVYTDFHEHCWLYLQSQSHKFAISILDMFDAGISLTPPPPWKRNRQAQEFHVYGKWILLLFWQVWYLLQGDRWTPPYIRWGCFEFLGTHRKWTATSSASSNSLYHCPYSSSVESRRISRKNDRGYGRTRSSRRLFGTRVNAFDEIERLDWGFSSLHTINWYPRITIAAAVAVAV